LEANRLEVIIIGIKKGKIVSLLSMKMTVEEAAEVAECDV
jgi:hypothetical protein